MHKPNPPTGFNAMHTLRSEGMPVDLVLADGEIVAGRLFCGMPGAPRSYWMADEMGRSTRVEPIGWRQIS